MLITGYAHEGKVEYGQNMLRACIINFAKTSIEKMQQISLAIIVSQRNGAYCDVLHIYERIKLVVQAVEKCGKTKFCRDVVKRLPHVMGRQCLSLGLF